MTPRNNPTGPQVYLRGPCRCHDKRDCWHGPCAIVPKDCTVTDTLFIKNQKGFTRAVQPDEVVTLNDN